MKTKGLLAALLLPLGACLEAATDGRVTLLYAAHNECEPQADETIYGALYSVTPLSVTLSIAECTIESAFPAVEGCAPLPETETGSTEGCNDAAVAVVEVAEPSAYEPRVYTLEQLDCISEATLCPTRLPTVPGELPSDQRGTTTVLTPIYISEEDISNNTVISIN